MRFTCTTEKQTLEKKKHKNTNERPEKKNKGQTHMHICAKLAVTPAQFPTDRVEIANFTCNKAYSLLFN